MRLKDRIQKGAAGAALFPQKQIAGRHIREGEAVFLQERVIRREDEHQLVAGKRLAGQVAMLDRRFDHGQIEAVIQQHLLERIDVGDGGLQAQARPLLLHAAHNAGQLVIAQRDARADAQHAALVAVAQLALHLVERIDDVHGVGAHAPPAVGQIEPLVQPLEQANAVYLLDFMDGAGDGGLGHVQVFRRAGDVHRAADLQKDADVADGHGNRSYHIKNDMGLMK